jgi:hypothetical protein
MKKKNIRKITVDLLWNFSVPKSACGMESYMKILLDGSWHVELEDGTTGQMDLPGTLDENGIGHRDVGANQWHPDAALGNAAGEIANANRL